MSYFRRGTHVRLRNRNQTAIVVGRMPTMKNCLYLSRPLGGFWCCHTSELMRVRS